MSQHALSAADSALQAAFESGALPPSAFRHREHVILAYAYLVLGGVDSAYENMRKGLLAYLRANRLDSSKYHETLTRAWILAVWHFMQNTPAASSADDFIAKNPILLDSRSMLTHYSAELLFSPEARRDYVEPDLDPIPAHRK